MPPRHRRVAVMTLRACCPAAVWHCSRRCRGLCRKSRTRLPCASSAVLRYPYSCAEPAVHQATL
ncbi:hypothetical protein E2C01_073526 [Portunus trituberculatus]|uniref:Uncharacterized protein n=1 Tax=Portunus trituberculatus TaxID=210409 RepID=A0A5B7IE61_PORTR|nr:hypothetical protein [Portunus trituberculatus]